MTGLFLINVLLALAWAAIWGNFSEVNLIFGFVLGSLALYMIREQLDTGGYFGRTYRIVKLALLFLYELVLSAVRVVKLSVTPDLGSLKPAIFAYPLTVERDFEITLLANLITLTPGTLSVDVSDDRKTLYVHAIHVPDVDAVRRDIADGFERKILEAFR